MKSVLGENLYSVNIDFVVFIWTLLRFYNIIHQLATVLGE